MPPPDIPDLSRFGIDDLRRAVAIYLATAYGGEEPPEAVKRRLAWPEAEDLHALIARPPFERASKPGSEPIHALRLGNRRYPHMKLQVQPWPTSSGIMLSVNTHDQVLAVHPSGDEAEAFRALQAENARIKEEIEQAWNEAGLPTFLRYLRDYLENQAGASP